MAARMASLLACAACDASSRTGICVGSQHLVQLCIAGRMVQHAQHVLQVMLLVQRSSSCCLTVFIVCVQGNLRADGSRGSQLACDASIGCQLSASYGAVLYKASKCSTPCQSGVPQGPTMRYPKCLITWGLKLCLHVHLSLWQCR